MRFLLPFAFGLVATTAQAEISLNLEQGLVAAENQLTSLSSPTPSDQMAIGAVRFLHGVEKTLQIRWQYNATFEDYDLPVLRLPIPPNPHAKPFDPALVTQIFADLTQDMSNARTALDTISQNDDVAVNIDLQTLWFDINMNGKRDPGENLLELGAFLATGDTDFGGANNIPPLQVRFDTADVAWLTAYTHLLSGIGELVVAFDPTDAIEKTMSSSAAMDKLRGKPYESTSGIITNETDFIDKFATVYGALNRQPDPAHARKAYAHFQEMIQQNKIFWNAVSKETDDNQEWIPNAHQTAALGFDMPVDAANAWQAILADLEAMLNGELLITHWRIAPTGGINVKKIFLDPPVVDIVTWFHGEGLLPYMERGPVMSRNSFRQFENMFMGDALLFAFLLN